VALLLVFCFSGKN